MLPRCDQDFYAHLRSDLHLFGETQPDLNWDCVEVRDSLYDILRWWLDKGIDGFRVRSFCSTVITFVLLITIFSLTV